MFNIKNLIYRLKSIISMNIIKLLVTASAMIVLLGNNLQAQGLYAQDLNGSPIRTKQYLDINGSPYFLDRWEKGTVQLDNGQTYSLDLKYDLLADELLFRNKNGDSLNFVQPVKEFKLSYIDENKQQTHLFRNGFPSTGAKTNEKSFYEVLYDGGTKLLKRRAKSTWMESTTYGTANQTKNITERVSYFIVKQGKIMPVKNDRKSVIAALGDKSAEMDKYIKDNKLDVKQDDDLIKLVTYYNSL